MSKRTLKICCIVLAICVLGIFVFVMYMDKKEQEETRLYYEQMNEELLPIQDEIHKLRNELTQLEVKYQKEKRNYATIQIVFSAPIAEIYNEIYPLMEEYDCVGIIAVSAECFPGKEGWMTVNEAKMLAEAGWQFCMRYEGGSFAEVEALAQDAGITLQKGVYFKNGSFSSGLDIVREMDYVIHHGEGDKPLLTYTKEDRWYLGALGWYTMGVSDVLSEALIQGANIVYTIGPDTPEEIYENSQFKKMLQKITEYEDMLVTDLTSINDYQGDEADEEFELNYQNSKQEIEEKIKALQEKEQAIYDTYMK